MKPTALEPVKEKPRSTLGVSLRTAQFLWVFFLARFLKRVVLFGPARGCATFLSTFQEAGSRASYSWWMQAEAP